MGSSWYTRHRKKPDGIFYDNESGRVYEHNGYSKRIFWSAKMLEDLRKMYPTTLNEELSGYLGVSIRTMIRKARQLGLEKDGKWLSNIWDQNRRMAHFESRRMGFPGGFQKGVHSNPSGEFKKGHIPSEETKRKQIEGLKRAWQRRKAGLCRTSK